MKKVKLFFVIFVMLIFITACQQKVEELPKITEPAAVSEDDKNVDLCTKVDLMNEDLTSLYKDLENAEDELEGLKIDLEYAKQDKVDTAELELLIKNQEDYISKINSLINGLQNIISEC
jgi:hypothetical protein